MLWLRDFGTCCAGQCILSDDCMTCVTCCVRSTPRMPSDCGVANDPNGAVWTSKAQLPYNRASQKFVRDAAARAGSGASLARGQDGWRRRRRCRSCSASVTSWGGSETRASAAFVEAQGSYCANDAAAVAIRNACPESCAIGRVLLVNSLLRCVWFAWTGSHERAR